MTLPYMVAPTFRASVLKRKKSRHSGYSECLIFLSEIFNYSNGENTFIISANNFSKNGSCA